ncbi:protein LNK2 isoform X3 [Lolium perenne]|uniref:protein LNK2 isoform X3 n=1 Tax=Lolium perenne TaxID=4522 RepID=UPI0021F601E1|nr:protein LNK2-like isoform X3 [Lolium perenne]
MLDWNDQDQQQAGDKIWAELNENEDPAVPNDTKNDGTLVYAGYQKKNDNEAATVPALAEPTSDGPTGHPALQKQPTPLDMESWPDLPSLTSTLDRNDYIASTYLDFSSAPAVQKVAGITSVQLNGEPEVFGSEHDEKSNNFLDCNWGNIGDFDDFDRLFSNSEALFRDEVVVNGSNFLSTSSAVVDGTAQSIPSLGDVQKRPTKSRRKPEERSKSKTSNTTSGFSQEHTIDSLHSLSRPPAQHVQTLQYTLLHDSKYMERFQHANQFKFPGYGYPAMPFPSIPLVSNIQAEGHQANPVAASCRTSVDSPKQSSSTEKPLMMTPQEKIEKLRRRQQRQALIAIQQQKQQFGQEGSGSSTLVAQAYSPRKKNPDYSSGIIDENAPQQTSAGHEEIQRESGIPDDPFLEEKIYYELKDALGKLDTNTRLSIRDSLLRLANSSSQRQIAGYRTISDNSKRGEDDITENGASNKRKRSPSKEAETDTNPIDRIVAHLLFHRPCSTFATSAKEETLLLTPVSLEADPKMP